MSESAAEQAAEQTQAEQPAQPQPGRGKMVAAILIGAVLIVTGAITGLGGKGAVIAGLILAGLGVAGLILWRLPHLRKHFARPKGVPRPPRPQRRFRIPQRARRDGSGRQQRGGRSPAARNPLRKLAAAARKEGGRAAGKLIPGRRHAKDAPQGGTRSRAPRRWPLPFRGRASRPASGRSPLTGARIAKRGARGTWSLAKKAVSSLGVVPLVPAAAAVAVARRIRSRIQPRRGKPGEASAPKPAKTDGEPQPQPSRQPGAALAPSATTPKRRSRVSSRVEAATDAIEENIGSFEPENVEDLGSFLRGLPGLYDAVASSLSRVADRFGDELPVDNRVSEHIREMASQAAGLREYADEAYGIFRAAHEEDLNRLENPRPNEQFMDVSQQ